MNDLHSISLSLEMWRSREGRQTYPTTPMDVVEAEEDLSCDLFDDMFGNTSILIPLDEAQQVFSEDLKNHAYVLPKAGYTLSLAIKRML